MKSALWMAILLMPCAGCTTWALSLHTVNQSKSISGARYHEVLHNLAITAHNPGELPSFASLSGGTVNVTNNYGFDPTTSWDASAFTKQMLTLTGKHIPEQQWTVNPVSEVPQLEAVWYACQWVVIGPPPVGSPAWNRLRAPIRNDDDQYHFGVEARLQQLPPNWLGKGRHGDVPRNAAYTAHCRDTYVWITPESMMAMSDFLLVILDIASTDTQSIVWQRPVASVDVKVAQDTRQGHHVICELPELLPPIDPLTVPTCPTASSPTTPTPKPPVCSADVLPKGTTKPAATITYQIPITQLDDCAKTIIVPTPPTNPKLTFCFDQTQAAAVPSAPGTGEQKGPQAPSLAAPGSPRRYPLNGAKAYSLQAQGLR